MQILLFLTALLSALTGITAGPRADQSRLAQAEERLISAIEAIAPARAVFARPLHVLPALVAVSAAGLLQAPLPLRPAPLATVKRVE